MNEPERTDPYTHVFGAEAMDERLFPPIAEEAEARDVRLDDPDRFLFLSSVGQLLQAIAGDDSAGYSPSGDEESGPSGDEGSDPGNAAPKDALRLYGRLLFHAFHFWRDRGERVGLEEAEVRWLLDEVTRVGDWELRPPAPVGYLQLPRNLLWTAPGPDLTPEPADGFFWMFADGDDDPPRLHVLLVLGVRPDRPGFSVVPATGVLDDESHWAEVTGREDGTDFETDLPGGEIDRLYSIETAAELLKLASRAFWQLDPATG